MYRPFRPESGGAGRSHWGNRRAWMWGQPPAVGVIRAITRPGRGVTYQPTAQPWEGGLCGVFWPRRGHTSAAATALCIGLSGLNLVVPGDRIGATAGRGRHSGDHPPRQGRDISAQGAALGRRPVRRFLALKGTHIGGGDGVIYRPFRPESGGAGRAPGLRPGLVCIGPSGHNMLGCRGSTARRRKRLSRCSAASGRFLDPPMTRAIQEKPRCRNPFPESFCILCSAPNSENHGFRQPSRIAFMRTLLVRAVASAVKHFASEEWRITCILPVLCRGP